MGKGGRKLGHKQTELVVGPSTGWLYAQGVYSLFEQERILKEAGVNAVEMCLGGWETEEGRRRLDSLKTNEKFDAGIFRYQSLHIPDFSEATPAVEQIRPTLMIKATHSVATILIHPLKIRDQYPTGFYIRMREFNRTPLAIENMDSRKDSGFDIEELVRLINICYGIQFVLDVQHAYEHDPEMGYAKELFRRFKDTLAHLHISGETEDNIHSLVHKARNAGEIIEFLGWLFSQKQVPIILEGEYTSADELRKEIEFLKKELGF